MDVVHTEEGKGGLHHGRPESKEFSKGATNVFRGKSTGFLPISEASPVVVRTAAEGKDEGAEDDSQDHNNLEGRQPELQFTKDFDTEVVDDDDGHHENGDPDTGIDFIGGRARPVGDYQGRCCQLRWW